MNKADLPSQCDLTEVAAFGKQSITTSAVTGVGIAELLAAIASLLVPEPPAIDMPALFTSAQVEIVQAALAAGRHDDAAGAKSRLREMIE